MVRKRKSSGENISPVQTRRGRVKSDETSETPAARKSKKSPPATERRTTRTRAQGVQVVTTATKRGRKATKSKSSSDSDTENAPETSARSRCKNTKEESQIEVTTRSRKRKDVNVSQESLNSTKDTVTDVSVIETKKRGKKTKESSLISEDESPPVKKRSPAKKKSPAKKPQNKRSPAKSSGRNARAKASGQSDSLISEDELPGKRTSRANTSLANSSKNSLITDDESTLIDKSDTDSNVMSKRSMTPKKIIDTPRKSGNSFTKSPLSIVTPESSPMVVSLTPHRTTKTPRKSPMNLSSPKTHSYTPTRLSKTPRKLPIMINSPAASEKSGVSSNRSTPRTLVKSGESAGNTPIVLASMSEVSEKLSQTPGKSGSTSQSPSSGTKLSPIRFSKSPKIVLKSPKSKSPTSLKKRTVRASKVKRSPVKASSNKSPKKSPANSVKKSPLKSPISAKSPGSAKKLAKTPSPKTVSKSPKAGPSKTPLKNPRIILSAVKTPTRTPLKKVSTPASKIRKSPIKTPSSRSPAKTPSKLKSKKTLVINATTPISKIKNSPLPSARKSVSIVAPKNSPIKTPLLRRNSPIKSPRKSPVKKTPMNLKKSPVTVNSPKRPRSTIKKRSPITALGTPLRPIPTPRNSTLKKSALYLDSPIGGPDKITNKNLDVSRTLSSSSPRGRIRRSLNMSPDFKTISPEATSSPISTPKGSLKKSPQALRKFELLKYVPIENESNPLINESGLIELSDNVFDDTGLKKDGTYELTQQTSIVGKEQGDVDNATYELAEPKTPGLRSKSRKRSLSATDFDKNDPETKKRCRVRFASPLKDKKPISFGPISPKSNTSSPRAGVKGVPSGVTVRSTSSNKKTPENRRPGAVQSRSSSRSLPRSRISETTRRRSNSTCTVTPVVQSGVKRRSCSASDVNAKTPKLSQKTLDSVNRLSKPRPSINSERKPDRKTPIARKAPNFAQIHQKKFAKMESLVDAKKRVAERHVVMSSAATANTARLASKIPTFTGLSPSKKVAPADTTNGVINRFGFKLRKTEAMDAVSKKQPPAKSRDKKQEEKRTLLKSVRMNRRFELQMQSRNLKP